MDEEISSSQETNKDPAGFHSAAAEATLTLVPINAEAKLAFSEVVDWTLQQNDTEDAMKDARKHTEKFISILSEQERDEDVSRLLRQREIGELSSSPSNSLSSPAADASPNLSLVYVWKGCYYIDLRTQPFDACRGWTAGRPRKKSPHSDMVLCLNSDPVRGIKSHHVTFQVENNGRVSIRASPRTLDSVSVGGMAAKDHNGYLTLTDAEAQVRLGNLEYIASYTRFALENKHQERLERYLREVLRDSGPWDLSLTPTPADNRQVGQWTLTQAGTIGVGGEGRVSVGVHQSTGKVVAMKRVTTSSAVKAKLLHSQRIMEDITRRAEEAGEERILKLLEVASDNVKGTNKHGDVWFVLFPVAPSLETIVQKGGLKCIDSHLKIKQCLVAILGALQFLDSNAYIHGDIKPGNIGVRDWKQDASSVVLLDTGTCIKVPQLGGTIAPTPGTSGTIGWLSPEREVDGFDATTDIWSLGVVALWLFRGGNHPWHMRWNPWIKKGDGKQERHWDEVLRGRGDWERMYSSSIESLQRVEHMPDHVLADAVLSMLRFPYASTNAQKQRRPTAEQALTLLNQDNIGRAKKRRG